MFSLWWILWTKDSPPRSQIALFNYWVYHQDSNVSAFYYSDNVLHIDLLSTTQLVKSYCSNGCLDIWTWGSGMKWPIHLININNSFLILTLSTVHGFGWAECLVFYPQELLRLMKNTNNNNNKWFFLMKWGAEESSGSKEKGWKGSESGQITWCYSKRLSVWNPTERNEYKPVIFLMNDSQLVKGYINW